MNPQDDQPASIDGEASRGASRRGFGPSGCHRSGQGAPPPQIASCGLEPFASSFRVLTASDGILGEAVIEWIEDNAPSIDRRLAIALEADIRAALLRPGDYSPATSFARVRRAIGGPSPDYPRGLIDRPRPLHSLLAAIGRAISLGHLPPLAGILADDMRSTLSRAIAWWRSRDHLTDSQCGAPQ